MEIGRGRRGGHTKEKEVGKVGQDLSVRRVEEMPTEDTRGHAGFAPKLRLTGSSCSSFTERVKLIHRKRRQRVFPPPPGIVSE